jgi:SAM-dependent methyltransferase
MYPTMSNYSKNFYLELAKTSDKSANVLAPLLIKKFHPFSVVDFGCGTGSFCKAFIANGITDVLGIEGEWILEVPAMMTEKWLKIQDLKSPISLQKRFDLAICLEVAEHLPPDSSRLLINSLVKASDRIAFSAAIPGQSGTEHINLQFPDFWGKLFEEHEYFLEWDPRNEIWNTKGLAPWYKQNLLIFHKRTPELSIYIAPETRFHPEIFIQFRSNYFKLNFLLKRILRRILRLLKAGK